MSDRWDRDWNRGWVDWNGRRSGGKHHKHRHKGRKYNHYYGINDAWWYPYWNQYVAPIVNPIVSTFWPYPLAPGYGYPATPYIPGYPGPTIPPIYYP